MWRRPASGAWAERASGFRRIERVGLEFARAHQLLGNQPPRQPTEPKNSQLPQEDDETIASDSVTIFTR